MTVSSVFALRRRYQEILVTTGYIALPHPSRKTLEWVFAQQGQRDPILIGTVIKESSSASPSVLHASIRLLIDQGFLSSRADPEDTRRRILTLTPKAQKLMEQLSSEALKLAAAIKVSARKSR